jgi:hypothetical protein
MEAAKHQSVTPALARRGEATPRRRVAGLATPALAAIIVWSPLSAGASGPPPTVSQRGWSCAMARAQATLTLSFKDPAPAVAVRAGATVSVLVPPWHFGRSTNVSIASPAVVREVCTVLGPNGWRRALVVARAPGRSLVTATVTPASSLMMPGWRGTVTVLARGTRGAAASVPSAPGAPGVSAVSRREAGA